MPPLSLAIIWSRVRMHSWLLFERYFRGYHIYLPVEAFVLEEENEFAKFDQPSRRFIQFAEQYLSNKKSDPCHAFTISLKNCMLRVPGSYNSKLQPVEEVKVIQKWDGNRSSIKLLLFDSYKT